jgi:hypothetical protein
MAARVFISYSHADASLLERLHKHLAQLQRDGSLDGWYDREITAGGRFEREIESELARADIFLACASPDYLASTYCMDKELQAALEREAKGDLLIVPVIFEPCEWPQSPLGKFKAVPRDGKAVSEHTNINVALLDVASELRRLADHLNTPIETKSIGVETVDREGSSAAGRYRVKKDHDALHKRDFVETAFVEIYKFFEASAQEVTSIPDIEARLTPLSGDVFSCTIINRGFQRGFETLHVRRGGNFGAIDILYGKRNASNTSNGGFSVESDEYELFLRPSMFNFRQENEKLSPRQAAQMLWDDLLRKVGIDYA